MVSSLMAIRSVNILAKPILVLATMLPFNQKNKYEKRGRGRGGRQVATFTRFMGKFGGAVIKAR